MARARGLLSVIAIVAGCGESGIVTGPVGATVLITGYQASPERVTVEPGGSVLVINHDPIEHTVTSGTPDGPEAGAGLLFDSQPFSGQWVVRVPADIPAGTIIPWFCRLHRGAPSDRGLIEVVSRTR